jgi:alkylhydroperoxidase/carboxymuconolactone decarboxylase family protein YurZ
MASDDVATKNYVRVNQADPPAFKSPVGDAAMDFVFGKLWGSEFLSWRERRICSLTCAAISGQSVALDAHVRGALKSKDLSVDELRALAVHVAAYAGFPVGAFMEMTIQKIMAES